MKEYLRIWHVRLLAWPRWAKKAVMITADAIAFPLILLFAYMLRLDIWPYVPEDLWMLAAAPALSIGILYMLGTYNMVVRFIGTELAITIAQAMFVSSALLASLAYMVPAEFVPRSVFIIYALLGALYLSASRTIARRYLLWASGRKSDRKLVVIYGAGNGGIQAASALSNGGVYQPVAFVDDNPALHKELLLGLPVINRKGLKNLLEARPIEAVLLAMPSVSRQKRMEVVNFLETLEVSVKTIPAIADIMSGKARIEEVRDVTLEDLLGREPVPPRRELIELAVKGKHVLVSGAGGSIGSELCRQIAHLQPKRLVLFELSEIGLYSIEMELNEICQQMNIELHAVLGSVTDNQLLTSTFADFAIHTVYHAAAYKHVPMVEQNVCSGVNNNVLGTLAIARAAELAGVERFILISTDKAVRPTNVMGATKRMAEMVLQAMAEHGSKTIFSMVRFGNVLGSSGSVVPLFREQIRRGGPVTVTHPDIIRYFMTIPEAAQLVIQAGAMARGGEVFVLDMGEPVRILDLANTMIHLMGLSVKNDKNPQGDIEITFSGLRPGEKLFEELLIGEDSQTTDHPAILRAHEESLSWQKMDEIMSRLIVYLQERNEIAIREILQEVVSGYRPARHGA